MQVCTTGTTKVNLHYIPSRNVRAAMKLLEAGATVEGKDNEGRTVLHLAAQHGHVKLLDMLIKNNANVNDRDTKVNLPCNTH